MQPPPAPRMQSKMDSLIFTADSVKSSKVEEAVTPSRGLATSSDHLETKNDLSENDPTEVEVENVERPVDLYKVNSHCPFFWLSQLFTSYFM